MSSPRPREASSHGQSPALHTMRTKSLPSTPRAPIPETLHAKASTPRADRPRCAANMLKLVLAACAAAAAAANAGADPEAGLTGRSLAGWSSKFIRKCGGSGQPCCYNRCKAGLKCTSDVCEAPPPPPSSKSDCTQGECCGDPDCPPLQWCLKGNVCGTKCGMEVRALGLRAAPMRHVCAHAHDATSLRRCRALRAAMAATARAASSSATWRR